MSYALFSFSFFRGGGGGGGDGGWTAKSETLTITVICCQFLFSHRDCFCCGSHVMCDAACGQAYSAGKQYYRKEGIGFYVAFNSFRSYREELETWNRE